MYCIKKILRARTLTSEQKYKLYKNKLTTILRFAEKSYYSSLLVANMGYAKSTWNVLNTVIKCVQMNYPSILNAMMRIYQIHQSLPTNVIHYLLLSDQILPMHSQKMLIKVIFHFTLTMNIECWGWTTITLFFCPPPFQPSQCWVKIVVIMLLCSMLEINDVVYFTRPFQFSS